MNDNKGNGVSDDGVNEPGQGAVGGAGAINGLNKNSKNKFMNRMDGEILSPKGSDGSTINVGTANQVQSMTRLRKCEEIKDKYMGVNFKQMANKQ